MKIAIVLAVLFIGVVFALDVEDLQRHEFLQFQRKFNKVYASADEEESRFKIFQENLKRIADLNRKNDGATYGINQFADMTQKEFKRKMLMNNLPPLGAKEPVASLNRTGAPQTFDWRTHSPPVVTPVYNQQQCGSCWAFSATENIESRWALAGNTLVSLSMQQIVDCDTTDDGCNGGWPYNAYTYVKNAGGLDPYVDYPYVGVDQTCAFKPSQVAAKLTSWEYVTNNQDENQMANYLSTKGPLSVCVDAETWSYYSGGVYPAAGCGTSIDHCVDAVGYNLTANPPYWIIRNSWGASWGLSGYMHLAFGQNACAVAEVVTSSIIR